MGKGNKGFSSLLTDSLDEEAGEGELAPARSIMASRTDALSRLATGKVVTDRTQFVDPSRCRPWRLHNRDLDHLDEHSCADLIGAFLSAKKQRIPAIVRSLRDDPDCDFEIIAGVRRWWTVQWLRENNHPEFEFLVTVQALTDEEAFRVSDVENRARKDITDWERAHEYENALVEFYSGSATQMAEHLNISKSWLSRMLNVARLPKGLLDAFADPHDITVRIARELKPLTANERTLGAMEHEAQRISDERRNSGKRLSGPETSKRLIAATAKPEVIRSRQGVEIVKSEIGKPMLKITGSPKSGISFKVLPESGADKKEVLAAIRKRL
ncbi:MAG: ParB/RepB/Spo0J family partition protein [Erythrobacter sp.]